MKYIKLYEDFDFYDSYELMILSPNKKAEMLYNEIKKKRPNLDLIEDLITLGTNLDWINEDSYNRTFLHLATVHNKPMITQMLIEAGANIESKDIDGRTPLHLAVKEKNSFITEMLIEAGANVNARDEWKNISLHYAAYGGFQEITEMLIVAGSDINAMDSGNNSPLHDAVSQDNEDVAIILVKAGARRDIPNEDGEIPYDLAETEEMRTILSM